MVPSRYPLDPSIENKPYNTAAETRPDFGRGLNYLKEQVKTLPIQPGVYRMTDANGEALFGKARHLGGGSVAIPTKQIIKSAGRWWLRLGI